jgi:hypothetical protein
VQLWQKLKLLPLLAFRLSKCPNLCVYSYKRYLPGDRYFAITKNSSLHNITD